jgi:TIR domain-containing protein
VLGTQAEAHVSHVFISYSSDERELAEAMCARLEQLGLDCWIAPRNIPPGDVYASAIVDAIESAVAFVLLLTATANESDHVFRELELASASARRVVPVLIAGVQPSRRIRFFIASTQWLAADVDNLGGCIDALAVALRTPLDAIPTRSSVGSDLDGVSDS